MSNPAEPEVITVVLTAAMLGQSALAAALLCARSASRPIYLFLAGFFLVNAITDAGPVALSIDRVFAVHVAAFGVPAVLAAAPFLWFYVVGLTANREWTFSPADLKHLIPAALGLLTAAMIEALPFDQRQQLLFETLEVVDAHAFFATIAYVLMTLAAVVQIAVYIPAIFRRLVIYRRQLKDVFSSTEHLEMRWLGWMVVVFGGYWLISLASVAAEIFYQREIANEPLEAAIALGVVWALAIWGLRQQPGFAGYFAETDEKVIEVEENLPEKYEKSALTKAQSQRIAEKLEASMRDDGLYRNSNLSLRELAAHVAVTPNYVSQTLNETVGESFFDYVNRWRINAAKQRVIHREETILAVAYDVGFNSRSSFYTAFKRETGMTPTEFRAAAKRTG